MRKVGPNIGKFFAYTQRQDTQSIPPQPLQAVQSGLCASLDVFLFFYIFGLKNVVPLYGDALKAIRETLFLSLNVLFEFQLPCTYESVQQPDPFVFRLEFSYGHTQEYNPQVGCIRKHVSSWLKVNITHFFLRRFSFYLCAIRLSWKATPKKSLDLIFFAGAWFKKKKTFVGTLFQPIFSGDNPTGCDRQQGNVQHVFSCLFQSTAEEIEGQTCTMANGLPE